MTFPSISEATRYLQEKIGDFRGWLPTLQGQLLDVNRLIRNAETQKKSAPELLRLRLDIQESIGRYNLLARMLNPVMWSVGQERFQLGIPFAVAFAPIALVAAGLLYVLNQRIQAHRQAMDLLSRGITPPEAPGLLPALFTGGLTTPLLLAGVAVLGLWVMSRR